MQRQDVGVALHDDRPPLRRDRGPRAVEAVHHLGLLEELALGRVQVLRRLAAGHLAGAEPPYPAAYVGEREHQPAAKAIDRPAPSPPREAGLSELRRREPLGERGRAHPVPRRRREPEPEVVSRLIGDPALGEIRPGRLGLGGIPQVAAVELRGVVEQPEEPRPLGAAAVVLGRGLLVLEPDAVAVGERLDSPREVEVLGLADERDVVAAALAAEAVVDLLHGVDRERRGALVVERAAAHVAGAGAAKRGAAADEVDHVDRGLQRLQALAGDRAHAAAASAACARRA
jgi:hypothetical protein